jgi:sec-independent protein translocase protein TatA
LSAARPVVEEFPMGSLSIWHWIVVVVIVLLLFGRGKISELMGDVAQGIKSFKKGMSEDETPAKAEPSKSEPVKTIDHQTGTQTSDLQHRANTEKKYEGGTV